MVKGPQQTEGSFRGSGQRNAGEPVAQAISGQVNCRQPTADGLTQLLTVNGFVTLRVEKLDGIGELDVQAELVALFSGHECVIATSAVKVSAPGRFQFPVVATGDNAASVVGLRLTQTADTSGTVRFSGYATVIATRPVYLAAS